MHFSSFITITLLIVAVERSTAQLNKAMQAQCKAEMEPKFKAETDKDLAAKMAKGHDMLKSTVELVQGMTDAQKAKLVNSYFIGACAPIKDFYNL